MRTEKANAVRSQESSRSALKGLVGAVVLGGLLVIAAPGAAHGQDQGCQANEFAKLLPSDGGSGDAFGWRVAIAGDIAVVAAYLDGAGSAYVFMWDGSTWTLAAKLVPADGASGDGFGCSVAISGDTVVVGSYRDDGDTGAVYIFEKGVAWVDGSTNQATKLTACDGEAGDVFGASVALCGDTIVIGAPCDDGQTGSAYVFERGMGWADGCTNQVAKLWVDDGEARDVFGASVACSGQTVLIGANGHNDDIGAAYVFEMGAGWTDGSANQVAKLTACDGDIDDEFGVSVAMFGDTGVIGAFNDDNENGTNAGAAYVFERGSGWVDGWANQVDKLTASDGEGGAYLGVSVAISGDTVLVGAHYDDSGAGSAYVFVWDGVNWTQAGKLTASDRAANDQFGAGVAIDGDRGLVGAHYDDDNGSNSGSAYIFHGLSDCNGNEVLDICDIADGTSADANNNGVPDECEPVEVLVDIKPGSCPNPLNRNSHGVLPVALIDTEDFDVSLVDISSVRLYRADGVGGDVAPNEGPPGPHSVVEDVATPFDGEACGCHDLSGDGIDDLVMKFRTDDVVAVLELDSLNPGDEIELVVSGSLLDGTEFTSAGDCILILPPGLPDLTVMSSAADLFVEVSPMDLNIDGGGFESFERAYDPGTTLTLTAPASVGSRPFRAWAVDGVLQTRGQTVIEVTIAEAVTARPLYGPQPPKQHGTGSHGGPTPIER